MTAVEALVSPNMSLQRYVHARARPWFAASAQAQLEIAWIAAGARTVALTIADLLTD